jgi:hypothetical protein
MDAEPEIQALIQEMRARNVPAVAARVHTLPDWQRPQVVTPALTRLSTDDPASAQWFIRHILTTATREHLKQGIQTATIAYLQESGFVEGKDFVMAAGELILSRAVLPYAAADDDPFGQLLVAEFCQLQE